jgi:hypothetical protein
LGEGSRIFKIDLDNGYAALAQGGNFGLDIAGAHEGAHLRAAVEQRQRNTVA